MELQQNGIKNVRSSSFHTPHSWSRRGHSSPQTGLTRAASQHSGAEVDEERWEQDRLIFRVAALGQAASGHLDVADDHVRLEVTLLGCCSDLPKLPRSRSRTAASCC